jgi:ankyrin repeat protein
MDPFYEIESDRLENIKIYLELGGDPNVRDRDNNTMLHKILERYFRPSVTIVKLLLDAGFDPNAVNNENCTVLNLGPIKYDILELLLQHKYLINHQNKRGSTLLHRMCYDLKMVELLLSYGADVNIRNIDGDRPIDRARRNKVTNPVELLRIIELLGEAEFPIKEPNIV